MLCFLETDYLCFAICTILSALKSRDHIVIYRVMQVFQIPFNGEPQFKEFFFLFVLYTF